MAGKAQPSPPMLSPLDIMQDIEQLREEISSLKTCIGDELFDKSKKHIKDSLDERSVANQDICMQTRENTSPEPVMSTGLRPNLTTIQLEGRMNEILDGFKLVARRRKDFMRDFLKWEEDRKQLIESLKRIAEEMNECKKKVEIATIAGSAVGIGGGVSLAASAVSSFVFPPAGVFFLVGGLVVSGIGTVANVGSAVIGEMVSKRDVDKVKGMLEEDERKYNHLKEWIQGSQRLKEALAEVMSMDVFKDLKIAFSRMFGNKFNCISVKAMDLNAMWRMIQSMDANTLFQLLRRLLPKIVQALDIRIIVNICMNKHLFELLCIIVRYHDENPVVFQTALIKLKVSAFALCRASLGMKTAVVTARTTRAAAVIASRQAARAALARGVLSAAAIALDTVTLVQAAIELHKNVPSKYAIKIKETADLMEEELSIFSEMYEELETTSLDHQSYEFSFLSDS